MDKTTAILCGSYGVIAMSLVIIFALAPARSDVSHPIDNSNGVINQVNSNLLGSSNLADLFSKSDDGVVQIIVRKLNDSATDRAIGSGIVYDYSGNIITNNHVVSDAQKIRVVFHDGQSYVAKVIGTDPFADLAIVKVDASPDVFHPLQLGDSSKLRIGDEVAAIGSPFGLTGSMTSGIISQTGRLLTPPNAGSFSISNVIQTDTAINPGNSGGPLLDMQGDVIGITTAIQSSTGEFSGIGFAIPSNTMKRIIPSLIEDGHFKHSWLGISGSSIDPDLTSILELPVQSGFLIQDIVPNSTASKAGLQGYKEIKTIDGVKYKVGGDIIVGVDGNSVEKIEDILNYLQDQRSVGDSITLKIIRNGENMEISLTLQERPNVIQ